MNQEKLSALVDDVLSRVMKGGATDAKVVARAGQDLSVRVRMGETELVEEAGTQSISVRAMKGKRVATSSTNDLTAAGLARLVSDALELCDLSQEDPFAGLADPADLATSYPDLALYDPARVTRVTGIDPSQPLLDRAAPRAATSPVPVSLVKGGAERMPFDAGRFDSAVVTFTLCSIDEVTAALAELRRVLRAGAPVYFVEHGLSPSPSTQRWQRTLNPAWRRVSGGCSLDRDAGALFRAAGFAIDELDAGASPGLSWMSFKYRGVARRD